ncbi:minor head protein [Alteromonas phage vB_AcoS-R7M]|uniref:Minor head protein n=1 Tax=Alteromonas phage vB_AcoS-R7M TaxID=2729541 RepID=A0A6M3YTD8_9CAUD|nr:head morphogenesis [Alteromonas phage vB_AcoS-R7M]QJI53346.1 minor head protein [Alteromonas phage vB_AcoS-R7M]
MPNIVLDVDEENVPQWLKDEIQNSMVPMVKTLHPTIVEAGLPTDVPDNVLQLLREDALDNGQWNISVYAYQNQYTIEINGKGFALQRTIDPNTGVMEHNFFEINHKLQGKGLSQQVMELSDKLVTAGGLKRIKLDANLDVGGYAWLRKGFWPEDGLEDLSYSAMSRGKHDDLLYEFRQRISKMSEAQAKKFLLTDEFRKYKPLFLGSFWTGTLDTNDPLARAAMRYGAEAVQKSLPTNLALTANQKIFDKYVKHQIDIFKYAHGLTIESAKKLASSESALRAVLYDYIDAAPSRQLTGAAGREWQRKFEIALRETRSPAWAEVGTMLSDDFKEFAIAEAASAATVIQGSVPVILGLTLPPAGQLISVVNSQPFQGRTLKQWLERTEEADVQRMLASAKSGIINGRTPTDITRGIVGTVTRPRDSIARKAFNDVESVILTLTNGIQNEAKQALYQQNSDIIKYERYAVTLDSRTTVECAEAGSRHNKHGKGIYLIGEGPMPPLHFRCRSLRIPYFGPNDLVSRPFDPTTETQLLREYGESAKIGSVKNRSLLPRGHKTKYDEFARRRKRELIGQVPGDTTYEEWLKTQSIDLQNEVLGPVRASMFREGNLSLSKFVNVNGDTLTLDQLKQRGLEAPTT